MEKYSLTLYRKSKELPKVKEGGVVEIFQQTLPADQESEYYRVVDIQWPGILDAAREDWNKLKDSLKLPMERGKSARQFHVTMLIYLILSVSGIGSFFVRGWRFRIVQNMFPGNPEGVGPDISSFSRIGEMIFIGMKLVIAKLVFEIPKIFLLAAWGYTHLTAIAAWFLYFFQTTFSDREESYEEMLVGSGIEILYSLIAVLVISLLMSYIITPVYKIHEIKYAAGKISFRDFFRLSHIKDSLRIYRANKTKTLQKLIWTQMLTLVSLIVGLICIVIFPPLIIVHFLYKFYFSHWPKAYAFGLLGNKLAKTNQI